VSEDQAKEDDWLSCTKAGVPCLRSHRPKCYVL